MKTLSCCFLIIILFNIPSTIRSEVECFYEVQDNNQDIVKFLCKNVHLGQENYQEKMIETILSAKEILAKAKNVTLEFKNSSLTAIDDWIITPFTFTNTTNMVTDVNLQNCNISTISSDSLSSFKNLYRLNLNNNSITDYTFFQSLYSLQHIFFSHNLISDTDDFSKKLTLYGQLYREYLELANCNLTSFSITNDQNMYFVYIKEINLSYNDITAVSNEYASNIRLSLILRGNSNLKSIEGGSYSKLDLSDFKNDFDLSLLKNVIVHDSLIIRNSQIKTLDGNMLNINDIVRPGAILDFSNSTIEYIKQHFFKDTNLNILNLSLNNFYPGIFTYEFLNANIDILDLSNSKIDDISSVAFCNFTSKKLILSGNMLSGFGDIFTGDSSRNVPYLDLSTNKATYLEKDDFINLGDLESLDLSNNPIKIYDSGSFVNLKNLKILKLTVPNGNNISSDVLKSNSLVNLTFINSNITYLNDNNFINLSNLESLRFENCTVGNMTNNSLAGLFKLQHLDKNIFKRFLNITKIPWNLFKDLYSITELDLSRIYLINIDDHSFIGLENVNNLNLSNNFFPKITQNTFLPLKNLAKLDLSYCYILTPLPSGVFSSLNKLEYLSLKGNPTEELVTAGVLTNLANLVTLDLSNNKFRGFDVSALVPLKSIKNIFLDNNSLSLSVFPQFNYKNLTEFVPSLEYIDISNNNWQCNLLSKMLAHFKNNSIKYDPITPAINVTNVDGIECSE